MDFDKQQNHEEVLESDMKKALAKSEHSVMGFFIRRSRIIYILLALIFSLGAFAIAAMPKEAEPEVRVPFASVTTIYPGASPADIEDLIVDELEDKIEDVENIRRLNSSAGIGYASIFVEFSAEADIDKSIEDLKEAVDEAKPRLPDGAEDPVVADINFNDFPIVTYSLAGEYSEVELKNYADTLQASFEDLTDVSKVSVLGSVEREFQVLVDQSKLAQFNLSLGQVVGAISSSNFNLPSGEVEIGDFKYSVRVKGKFAGVEDLSDIILTYIDSAPIYLQDVAEIRDGFKERNTISKIGFDGTGSRNTVSLQIYKRTGGNILNIVKNAEAAIVDLQAKEILPANLEIIRTNDNSTFIKEDISRLSKSGLQTTFLIILILFVVLGIRGALITGFSVPIAFLISFIVLFVQGMTINSMVLFALILSLGLMVDNSIIVMEGINEYLYKQKKTPREAAILSVWNYKWPIITGTMTTVAAFLPMLLVSGIMGEYMGILPKTITATLLASLFVSLIIIPSLSAKFYKRIERKNGERHRVSKVHHLLDNLKKDYVELLRSILISKKKRRGIVAGAIMLVIFTIMMPVIGIMRIEMFPSVDFDYFVVGVELPTGSNLEKTTQVIGEVEKVVGILPELKNYVTNVGEGYSIYAGDAAASGEHVGSLIVNLIDPEERDRTSFEIAKSIRKELQSIGGAKVEVQELAAGPPSGSPFEVRVFGEDLQTLYAIAGEITTIAKGLDGLVNVNNSIQESSGEFVFNIDREKVAFYGLDVATVAQSIRQAVYGAEATEVNINGDDVDVLVKYKKGKLENTESLENILLFSRDGQSVTIKQVADLQLEPSVFEIAHYAAERVVRITAQTTDTADIRAIYNSFNKQVEEKINLPNGFKYEVGGEFEDLQRSYTEIFMSMFLAIFLIMFILVLQFDSFKQPFVIIFSLPLAIVGAFFGLAILNLAFSLPAFIGLVSLSGIVVNDAIVLIDRINKNLARNMDFIDGVVEAGLARMQPILLTSLTTIAGVFPLALSEELWAGLGFTIIFGLLFATVLTLIYIPVLYTSLCMKDYNKAGKAYNAK